MKSKHKQGYGAGLVNRSPLRLLNDGDSLIPPAFVLQKHKEGFL